MFFLITRVLIILLIFHLSNGYSRIHYEPIIDEYKVCNLSLFNTTHTLCNSTQLTYPMCMGYKHLPMTETNKYLILNGHNALRERLAYLTPISDMIKLEWDPQLAKMAYQWILRCKIHEKDPWTMIEGKIENEPAFKYTLIHQNGAFLESRIRPQYYEALIFTSWYMEKLEFTPNDRYTLYAHKKNVTKVFFRRESNFTMMAWSRLQRVGCALGQYHGGIAMFCNYYPFQGLHQYAYTQGPTASNCPNIFPLRSNIFDNLCTAAGLRTHVNVPMVIIMMGMLKFITIV